MLFELVENDENIGAWYRRPAIISFGGKTTPPPVFAIITTQNQMSEASQYADWSDRRGYPTIVVDVATIISGSSGRNNAEKVFNWIRTQYQAGISFVLFMGHEDDMPYRYLPLANDPSHQYDINMPPSDLYFSSVSCPLSQPCYTYWDCDGDELYGERDENPQNPGDDDGSYDYYPEVFIGRVLSKKNAFINEAQSWVTKVLKYEKDPGNAGNLTKVNFIAGADPCLDCEDTKNHYPQPLFTFNSIYAQDADLVISQLNTVYCGWVNIYSHGFPAAFATKPDLQDQWGDSVLSAPSIPHANLYQLTNTGKYYLVYSYACFQMAFDEESLATWWSEPNRRLTDTTIGEGFLEAYSMRGSAAFLGNTRPGGGGAQGGSAELHQAFLDYIFGPGSPGQNKYLIGVAEAFAKTKPVFWDHPWNARVHNLFGSPLTEMRDMASPILINTSHPSSIPPNQPVVFEVFVYRPTIPVTPVPDAMVCLKSSTGQIYDCKETGSDGKATFNFTPGPGEQWIKVTATKHNYKPRESDCTVTGKGPMALSEGDSLPEVLFLSVKSSNPANGSVQVEFGIPHEEAGHVSLSIYDASGREVTKLRDEVMLAGYYRLTWNSDGPSGVYFLSLRTGKSLITKKLILGGD